MTWEEIERKNLIAAGVILADLAKYGAESGLAQWAVLVRARRPTSPESAAGSAAHRVGSGTSRRSEDGMVNRCVIPGCDQPAWPPGRCPAHQQALARAVATLWI